MKLASIALAALIIPSPALANETHNEYDLGVLKEAAMQSFAMAIVSKGWANKNHDETCLVNSNRAMRQAGMGGMQALDAERMMVVGDDPKKVAHVIGYGMHLVSMADKSTLPCMPPPGATKR